MHAAAEQTTDSPADGYVWRAHPAREHPGKAALGGVIILALAALAWQLMMSPWWGLLAVLVMVAALNRFFFPSEFRIDAERITARFPLRTQSLEWSRLRRFAHDREAGYLSTRGRSSFIDAYRGMHVLFGRSSDDVIARIREHMPTGDRACP